MVGRGVSRRPGRDRGSRGRPDVDREDAMQAKRLTLKAVDVRAVLLPLKRPVVSKVGLFDQWPMVLIDLYTHEGVVGRSYLEPYLRQSVAYLVPAIRDLAEARKDKPIAPFDEFRS